MTGSLESANPHAPKLQFIVFDQWNVGKSSTRFRADIYFRAGPCRQFFVPRDKIRVKMRFEYVFYLEILLVGGLQVNVNVPLRIDHRRLALRTDHVRGMGQTG